MTALGQLVATTGLAQAECGFARIRLSPGETESLRGSSAALVRENSALDSPEFLAEAREIWEYLPVRLRQGVRRFRREPGETGTLLIEGVPIQEPLPPTPRTPDAVQRVAASASASLALIALGLGEPIAFAPEKSGALVQDVVPVARLAGSQSNAGSVELKFHTENAFHPHRPDYVMLLCLRSDRDASAALRVASVRQALPLLAPADREALTRPWFVTEPPPSFGGVRTGTEPSPVLTGAPEDPDIRLDFHATRPLGARAEAALSRLAAALDEVCLDLRLRPGQLAVLDNRIAVHGRSGFRPGYDGGDRWLHRMFVHADLRRSRQDRPGDGHVLADRADRPASDPRHP